MQAGKSMKNRLAPDSTKKDKTACGLCCVGSHSRKAFQLTGVLCRSSRLHIGLFNVGPKNDKRITRY